MTLMQRVGFGGLIGLHLALTAALWQWTLTLVETELGGVFVAGVMSAQTILLGLRLALMRQPLSQRLVGTAFMAALLWLVSCFVLQFGFYPRYVGLKLFVLPWLLVLIILGTLIPWAFFAVIGKCAQWQMLRLSCESNIPQAERFHLRQLFVALGMACLVLAMGRAILPPVDQMQPDTDLKSGLSAFAIGHIFAAAVLVVDLCFLLPGLIYLFDAMESRGGRSLALAVAAALISVGILTKIEVKLAAVFLQLDAPGLSLGMCFLNGTQFAMIGTTLVTLRLLGIRIHRDKDAVWNASASLEASA